MTKATLRKQDARYFRTSSFYTAAFLFTKDLELVNIDRTDSKRAQFVFRDCPEREEWLHYFTFGKEDAPETMVDARKFVVAIKQLKEKLYQNDF